MPNLDYWYGSDKGYVAPDAGVRAAQAWKRIQDKPSVIIVERRNTLQTAQTVRIEFDGTTGGGGTGDSGGVGVAPERGLTIFGIKDHATLSDTDLKDGDYIFLDDYRYEIKDIMYTIGEIQVRGVRR